MNYLNTSVAILALNNSIDLTMFFERFKAGELNRAIGAVKNPAGKGINVAAALKLYGLSPTVYGFSGQEGEEIERFLDEKGIAYEFVKTASPARVNVKLTDAAGVNTEANQKGGPITPGEKKALDEKLEEVLSGKCGKIPEYIVMSGSLPQGVEDDYYARLTIKAQTLGIKTAIDADKTVLEKAVRQRPWLIKPNRAELESLARKKFSTDQELIDFAVEVYERDNVNIVCTLGKEGAVYIGESGRFHVSAPKVALRGFTGAGDCFLAGFLADYIENGGDAGEAMRKAAALSAAKLECEGTNLPAYEDFEKYLDKVTLRVIHN